MKQLTYIIIPVVLFLILLVSCEDYYRPAIDEMPKVLVVDSHVTNDPNQNFVRISKTRSFYSTNAIEWASGALVELVESNFQVIKSREDGPGYYVFSSTPIPGRKYRLRITYLKDIFESDYGPIIPLGDDTSKHYLYGWITETNTNLFNLAGPKEFSVTQRIEKHPIVALAYNSYMYLDSTVQESYNWIIILDQYGIPKESYDFHEKLNRQFDADGTLFDPVIAQVYGNILCKNDPDKIVLGFFDLN